jgi:hypothetical protein
LNLADGRCRGFCTFGWKLIKNPLEIIASTCAIVTVNAIYFITCNLGAVALGIAIYVAIFGALGLVIALGVIIFSGTAEESIEGELRECSKVGGVKKE